MQLFAPAHYAHRCIPPSTSRYLARATLHDANTLRTFPLAPKRVLISRACSACSPGGIPCCLPGGRGGHLTFVRNFHPPSLREREERRNLSDEGRLRRCVGRICVSGQTLRAENHGGGPFSASSPPPPYPLPTEQFGTISRNSRNSRRVGTIVRIPRKIDICFRMGPRLPTEHARLLDSEHAKRSWTPWTVNSGHLIRTATSLRRTDRRRIHSAINDATNASERASWTFPFVHNRKMPGCQIAELNSRDLKRKLRGAAARKPSPKYRSPVRLGEKLASPSRTPPKPSRRGDAIYPTMTGGRRGRGGEGD